VGSGYGGGVAASRLARCGRSVCVLERGREVPTGEFPSRFPDLRRDLQITSKRVRTGPATALFDVRVGEHIDVILGCGLGGTSLINAGVALRPDARVFADEAWPAAFSRDPLLDEGFHRANRMLRPAPYPRACDLTKYKALEQAGTAIGHAPHAAPVTVNFTDAVNPAGVEQPACNGCGDCCSGCNVGAKNTVAMTYLPDAKRHGAEMFTGTSVSHVSRAGGRWQVWFHASDAGNGEAALECVEADIVVLGAGTIGSTGILLRSRERGLAMSPRLGHGFSANGDIIAFGYGAKIPVNAIGVGHPPKADVGPVGTCVAGQIGVSDADDLSKELYLQEGVMPSALAPLLPVAFIPGGRLLGAAQSLIKGVYHGPFARLHTFFAVSHDAAEGEIRLVDGGRTTVHWPDVSKQDVYLRLDQMLERTVKANGASYVKNPLANAMIGNKPATAHPLGGCGMGEDRSCGVINHKCQVFDGNAASGATDVHEGLYVCDGAAIPRSLGVNPLLTITGIAERAMMHLAADRQWRFDDRPVAAVSA
ncbi:MAG: GMC family oxidoreductase, partial [Pseudomonadota bacterium]|nr:GMC family oxidoreductase [Pseudomonadota bacterium]